MRKYSLRIAGHPTSISLEPEFWEALSKIAATRGVSARALIGEIDAARAETAPGELSNVNLSSAIRLFVLADLKSRIPGEAASG